MQAYKWVDWETRLCDWETQKQVCLYAERLPSFLLLRWKINARKFKPILYVYYYAHGLSSVGPEVIRKVTFRSLNNVELVPIPGSCWHLSSLYNVASILDLCCPAEARMVQIMAFLRAVILSSSWMTVLYDSSLYLEAASMNLRLKSSSRPWQTL